MLVNSGKELEDLVRLIQETLKDPKNTIIYSNAKVKNNSGTKREIDILIETEINNFNLKIAIECKDYKTPISVEKIEAFKGKCDRIPDINKKVFVSTHGYQKDAVKAAREFGIALYSVKDIDSSTILSWFPIKQLGLRMLLKDYRFALIATEDELHNLNSQPGLHKFFFKDKVIDDLNYFVFEQLKEHKSQIWDLNLLEFMRGNSNEQIDKITNMPFKIEFSNRSFISAGDGLTYPVGEITGSIDTWLVETVPDKIISKSFITNDETQAKYISLENVAYGKTEIVLTASKRKMFHTDLGGNRMELKTLGIYDPKTDTFTPANSENGLDSNN